MFRDEFLSFSVSFDYFPAKKLRKLKKRPNQRELVWDELVKTKLIDEDPDFEGSELREDQSSSAKKLFFMETNNICTELLQKTDSQRLLIPWLDTSASLVFFGLKLPFSRCLHQGLIFTDLKDFLYGVYWDQDQQLKHPENVGNSILKMTAPP
jgi:hypothetical protein